MAGIFQIKGRKIMTKAKINQAINFNLSDIAEGGVQEKFATEMKKVADNILDPNTEAKAKRKVTLEMTLVPNDNRDAIDVMVSVKSRLAPQVGVTTTMLLGRNDDTGMIEANELQSGIPGQTYIDEHGVVKDDKGTPVDQLDQPQNSSSKIIDLQQNN